MIIKKLNILFLKKKKFSSSSPYPSYFKDGFIFIKIFDETQNYGYGEPSPYILNYKLLNKQIKLLFIKFFKNQNIEKINFPIIKSKCKSKNQKKIISCFEHAILDLLSRKKKLPLNNLLGKKNKKNIELYGSGGMIYQKHNYDILLDEALRVKNSGFKGWKFRPKVPNSNLTHSQRINNPPKFDIEEVIKFSKKLRNLLGDKFLLMLDCGCRCSSVAEAEYLIKSLNDLNFYFVEEPLKRDFVLYKKLKKKLKMVKTKIAAGEHISDIKELKRWTSENTIDFIQPDTNLLLFEELKFLNKFSKKIIIHNWCNLINNCSNANFVRSENKDLLMEYNILKNPYNKFFQNNCYKIENGELKFKNYNGLGIEFLKKKKILNEINIHEEKV